MHTDDHLYHAIISAHHNRDPKAAQHLALRFPEGFHFRGSNPIPLTASGSLTRLGIANPITLEVASLISRPFAALASMVARTFAFLRVRPTAPCCAADCG